MTTSTTKTADWERPEGCDLCLQKPETFTIRDLCNRYMEYKDDRNRLWWLAFEIGG